MAKQKDVAPATTNVTDTPVVNIEGQTPSQDAPAPAAEPAKPEPTSPKLVELKEQLSTLLTSMDGKTNDEKMSLMMQSFQINKDIEAEKASIVKAENQRKLDEARNAKIALITGYKDTILAGNAEEEAKAFETLSNLILGSLPTKVKTTVEGDKAAAGTRGETGAAILAKYKEYRASGLNDTDARKKLIKEDQFNDGTVGIKVLSYLKEIGEK